MKKKLILIAYTLLGFLSYANDEQIILLNQKVSTSHSFWDAYRIKLIMTEDSLFLISKRKPIERNVSIAYTEIRKVKKGFYFIYPNKIIIYNKNGTFIKLGTWRRKNIYNIIRSKVKE